MIKGKSAIVTGSTSGIGLGIATALAEQGCNLLLNGFGDKAEIEKLRAGLAEKHRVKVAYSPADMSKPADIRAMVALAERELGACDILVKDGLLQFWVGSELVKTEVRATHGFVRKKNAEGHAPRR